MNLKIENVLVLRSERDRTGDSINIDGVEFPSDGVPVTLNYGRCVEDVLGRAKLTKKDGAIFADIELYKHLAPAKLFPCIGGQIVQRSEADPTVIEKLRITDVSLCTNSNVDEAIKPLVWAETGEEGGI